jgi:molybdenum cofactor synthesis domain-containing protein
VENIVKVGVLIISDRCFRGEQKDESGQIIKDMVDRIKGEVITYDIVPDDKDMIKKRLIDMADNMGCDLILTSGGTGLSSRDVTPEATKEVIDREIPGFGEIMRIEGFKITPHALLSRAIAGIRSQTMIINLPGSPKGVYECMEIILLAIPHGVEILKGAEGCK